MSPLNLCISIIQKKSKIILLILLGITSIHVESQSTIPKEVSAGVCIYAGTASGVMAAVAAAKEGINVLIVEPGRWLGGMTGGGISHIDWGNEKAVGSTTLEILKNDYDNSQYRKVFKELIEQNGIEVIYEHRLSDVQKVGKEIKSISLDFAPPDHSGCPIPDALKKNNIVVEAKIFIDCSYEGDLMANSGVSYAYGRESREEYGESLAGVQPNLNVYEIDPYKVKGDSASGLLPFLQDIEPKQIGTADDLTMGYCLRYKFDLSGEGIPIPEPENYNPAEFEMFRRGFENRLDLSRAKYMKKPGKMKEKKGYFISSSGSGNTNRSILTTTIWGINAAYPEGNWNVRSKIWKFHQDYFKSMIHFLRTDPTVPSHLKEIATIASFERGIFDDTDGWPHQLYVREARRMISSYVLTQMDIEGKTNPDCSVGLASYGVDEWPYALIPHEGNKIALYGGKYSEMILNESNDGIYKIPYQAIIPKAEECTNLIVPVCVSASHIAMTSIRMEPVWMILGESAGTAAIIAITNNINVQDVDYSLLQMKLLEAGQKLELPERNIKFSYNPGKFVIFENPEIEIQIDNNMYSILFYRKEGKKLSLDRMEKPSSDRLPSFYLATDKGIIKNFKLDFDNIQKEEINTVFGDGERLILRGVSNDASDIPVEKELFIELYEDFPATAIMYAKFHNNSTSRNIILNEVYSNCYQLDASNIDDKLAPHHFYSFYGTDGRILRQKEKIIPGNFNAINYTGRTDSLEGVKKGNGGIPIVDLWCKETGIGIGHIEKKWKNLYLPIKVQKDGRVFIAIREIPNINMPDQFALEPGESYKTVKTFVNAHTGDFYSTARVFSELMKRQGIDMQTPATENDYLSAWCSWNEYSTHGMASKQDVMLIEPIIQRLPELQKWRIGEVIFDAGWFNNQGDWMPNTDPLAFPQGESDMVESVKKIHEAGISVKLWISFLTADPWSEVAGKHPEWMIMKPDGSFHLDRWSGYTMCPSMPEVQEYHRKLAERLVMKYKADGFKVDGMYVCPPCYNPAHNHKNPNESSEDFHKVFKSFYDAAKSIDSTITIMSCPCGAVCDYTSLPYITETIAADPKSLKTVRRKAKLYRALKGNHTPYSSDYIDITKGNLHFPVSFANAVGIGAVPQAFYGTHPSADTAEIYDKWFSIYFNEMISKAEYLNLYDMGFDYPETHVLRKELNGKETYYYSFFADESEWSGNIEFRGLDENKNYVVYDYVNNKELGVLKGESPVMSLSFKNFLLVRCSSK